MAAIWRPVCRHGAIGLATGYPNEITPILVGIICPAKEVNLTRQVAEAGEANQRAEVIKTNCVSMRLLKHDLGERHRFRPLIPRIQGCMGWLKAMDENELISRGAPVHILHDGALRSVPFRLCQILLELAIARDQHELRPSVIALTSLVNLRLAVRQQCGSCGVPLQLGQLARRHVHFGLLLRLQGCGIRR